MKPTTLELAPGRGMVVRRPTALFFDPTGVNHPLIDAFDLADDDLAAVDAIKEHVVEGDFGSTPFAVVHWATGLHLLVFGSLELRTTARQVPMVSGAGSASWIEHHVETVDRTSVTVGDPQDTRGDLRLGLAAAGGLRLDVQPGEPAPPLRVTGAATAEPIPAPDLWTDPSHDEPDVPAVWRLDPDPVQADPSQTTAPPMLDDPATIDDWEHTATFAQPLVAAPRSDALAPDPFGDGLGAGPLADAVLCDQGHANPPRTHACLACGAAIGANPSESVVEQPVVGLLLFEDRPDVPVDRRIVLGRRPEADDGCLAIAIDHHEVSRDHAELTVEQWQVLIRDLGSRNGTWVVPPGDAEPIRLEPGVRQLLEPDSIVLLGGPEVGFSFAKPTSR